MQQAHRASDLAAQAANHALHQQQAADQARQEAGWIRERAVREVSDVRVQAAQLASQAQQAVQTAQQSEAQARQLIEQTRQEAIGHVENARQVVNATQQDAQQEVQRIVQEAQQAILQREQTIASQEHTIRGLSQENSVMHQRLGDLERVVAHLTQQARATPVPIQESPPKAASIAETATETSAAKSLKSGHSSPRNPSAGWSTSGFRFTRCLRCCRIVARECFYKYYPRPSVWFCSKFRTWSRCPS